MLRAIKGLVEELGGTFDPLHWIIDFEMAMYYALLAEFLNCKVHGCDFHRKKANLHHGFTELGLKKLFSENPILNKQYKRFLNIGHLPEALIPVAFDFITADLLPILRPFANYFQDNYIGRNGAPGRFPMSFWNVYERYV